MSDTTPSTFNNGLSSEQDERIDDARIAIARLIVEIEGMGRHRSYSLAVTKLEEASAWLLDRKRKAA